jgi:hypothetical protein
METKFAGRAQGAFGASGKSDPMSPHCMACDYLEFGTSESN